MIGDRAFDRQAAEPAIGHVDLKFQTKLALATDCENITDDQHPQHQLGIDRRSAGVTVIRRQFFTYPAQVQDRVELAHQVVGWNQFIKTVRIEKLILIRLQPPHHQSILRQIATRTESHYQNQIKSEFCNRIPPRPDLADDTSVRSYPSSAGVIAVAK